LNLVACRFSQMDWEMCDVRHVSDHTGSFLLTSITFTRTAQMLPCVSLDIQLQEVHTKS